jgi:hypothetical protein
MSQEKGKRRMVWLPIELDRKTEEIRRTLGLGYSAFYRFAILELVKQYSFPVSEKLCPEPSTLPA